jgi:hypothetical protein
MSEPGDIILECPGDFVGIRFYMGHRLCTKGRAARVVARSALLKGKR